MTAEDVATAWQIPVRLMSAACTIMRVNPGAARGSAIFVNGSGSRFYFLRAHDHPSRQIRFDTNGNDRVTQIGFGDSVSVHVVAGCA
jgi:hypothetical protein